MVDFMIDLWISSMILLGIFVSVIVSGMICYVIAGLAHNYLNKKIGERK